MLGNVRLTFRTILENHRKSSESGRKSSENHQKTPSSVCLYNNKNITRQLEDMNFMLSWQEQYPTRSLRLLVIYCSCHSNIKFISSRHRVMSSMYSSPVEELNFIVGSKSQPVELDNSTIGLTCAVDAKEKLAIILFCRF